MRCYYVVGADSTTAAWLNWAGWITIVPGLAQGTTYFLVSMLTILYPDSAVIQKGWFAWCLSGAITLVAMVPNGLSPRSVRWMLRTFAYSTTVLMAFYLIWFPIAASRRKGFQSAKIFTTLYNGINYGVDENGNTIEQASDSYCWLIGVLYGGWIFYGYVCPPISKPALITR